jgi:hypothetical protein
LPSRQNGRPIVGALSGSKISRDCSDDVNADEVQAMLAGDAGTWLKSFSFLRSNFNYIIFISPSI